MNIVDSSGWLAYFADETNAKHFLTPLSDSTSLVVKTGGKPSLGSKELIFSEIIPNRSIF
jgi:hypothetical protein